MKWAVIGTGNISHQFAGDSTEAEGVEIVAVATRSMEKGKKFAKEFSIPNVYTDYDEMLENEDIDNIYVGTPHTTHKDIVLYFLNNGKNVLCEKPLAVNRQDALEMIETAKANNVLLMEAMWTLFFPSVQKAKELIDNKHFGEVLSMSCNVGFGSNSSHDKWRYRNDMAGGALLDIGIYPIHFYMHMMDSYPDRYTGYATLRNDVDVEEKVMLDFNGVLTHYNGSIIHNCQWRYDIYCEQGSIHLDVITSPTWVLLHPYDGEEQFLDFSYEKRGMQYQIKSFDDAAKAGLKELPPVTYQRTLDAVSIMDGLRKEWNLVYPQDK